MRSTVLAILGLLPCAAVPAQDWPARQRSEALPDTIVATLSAPVATVSTRTPSDPFVMAPPEDPGSAAAELRFGPPPPAPPPATAGASLAGRRGTNVRDFGVVLGTVPTPAAHPEDPAPKPRNHDEGLASGGLEFGSRLVWDFENGLNYSFNDHFTGLIGYGSLPGGDDAGDDGPDLGIDGAVVGFTFEF